MIVMVSFQRRYRIVRIKEESNLLKRRVDLVRYRALPDEGASCESEANELVIAE